MLSILKITSEHSSSCIFPICEFICFLPSLFVSKVILCLGGFCSGNSCQQLNTKKIHQAQLICSSTYQNVFKSFLPWLYPNLSKVPVLCIICHPQSCLQFCAGNNMSMYLFIYIHSFILVVYNQQNFNISQSLLPLQSLKKHVAFSGPAEPVSRLLYIPILIKSNTM